ncbi:MAG: hypothetical protein RIS54_2139 [Verrucomicrobiota bacterium]|jgi:serine protease Do
MKRFTVVLPETRSITLEARGRADEALRVVRWAGALILGLVVGLVGVKAEVALEDHWRVRLPSVVALEFAVDTELGRQTVQTFGTVIDEKGTVIFPAQTINARLALNQLKDFRFYRPGDSEHSLPATYLGHDEFTGWEFARVTNPADAAGLTPITTFGQAPAPAIAQQLWGIGLRKKDEGFAPYFLSERVAIVQSLPRPTALVAREVTGTGLPVFDLQGRFVGLGVSGFGQAKLQFSARDRGGLPTVLIDPDECAAVLLASEIVPHLNRVPTNQAGRPMVWLGAAGLQPLEPAVADYLGLKGRSALVVGDVLENSPAAAAGLMARDVLVALDGAPLPAIKPGRMLVNFVQQEVDRRLPGEVMRLGVLRDGQARTITATLTDAPSLPREMPRRYFETLGVTVRGFAYVDGAARQVPVANHGGVIVNFLQAGRPAALAGLHSDEWIRSINGRPVADFAAAVAALAEFEEGTGERVCELGVERAGEAVQLRLQLK